MEASAETSNDDSTDFSCKLNVHFSVPTSAVAIEPLLDIEFDQRQKRYCFTRSKITDMWRERGIRIRSRDETANKVGRAEQMVKLR